jgi:hypothetical protein
VRAGTGAVVACEVEANRLHEQRHTSLAETFDGVVDLRALLDPSPGGAESEAELERLERYLADRKTAACGRWPTPSGCAGGDGSPQPHIEPGRVTTPPADHDPGRRILLR